MNQPKIKVTTAVLIGFALLTLSTSVAVSQDSSGESKPSGSKKAEEKKAETKKIDIHVRVSTADGKPLPPKSIVEISGQETACGNLNSSDERKVIDEKGEAIFRDLPVCKVTVKINVSLYLPVNQPVDLVSYRSPILLTLEPEK